MLVLGVTGGVATGKSTVMRMLASLSAPTMSADVLAHDLLGAGTPQTQEVRAAFPACADGSDGINRHTLGEIVFADAAARRRLEAILHPPIIAALRQQAEVWRSQNTAPAGALEIPLLFEAGLTDIPDRVVVVTCRPEVQLARVAARLQGDWDEARRRVAAQWPLRQKEARADFVIDTDGAEDNTRRQVEALWQQITT